MTHTKTLTSILLGTILSATSGCSITFEIDSPEKIEWDYTKKSISQITHNNSPILHCYQGSEDEGIKWLLEDNLKAPAEEAFVYVPAHNTWYETGAISSPTEEIKQSLIWKLRQALGIRMTNACTVLCGMDELRPLIWTADEAIFYHTHPLKAKQEVSPDMEDKDCPPSWGDLLTMLKFELYSTSIGLKQTSKVACQSGVFTFEMPYIQEVVHSAFRVFPQECRAYIEYNEKGKCANIRIGSFLDGLNEWDTAFSLITAYSNYVYNYCQTNGLTEEQFAECLPTFLESQDLPSDGIKITYKRYKQRK